MSKPTINRDSRYAFTHLESEYTYWAITPGHTIARLYVPIGRNPAVYSFGQEFITLQAYGRCRRILQITLPEGMEPDAEEACSDKRFISKERRFHRGKRETDLCLLLNNY